MLELKRCYLTCPVCHNPFNVLQGSVDFENNTEDGREMGPEVSYVWRCEDRCPICHTEYGFEITAWEYPIGFVNYKEVNPKGLDLDYCVDVVEDDWDDPWGSVEPSTYDEFSETIQELRNMLRYSLASTSGLFLKMIDAFAVTAMEAYLSGTLIKKIMQNDVYLLNAATKIDELKNEKMPLYEIIQNPNQAKLKIQKKLYEFMYHNLPKIKCIYEAVFGIKIDYSLKELMETVERRHNIVHRNGKDKSDEKVILTTAIIEQDLDNISAFVKKVNELLGQIDGLDTAIPAGC